MTDPAPPLTEAELNDLANSDGRFGPHTLDRVVAQARRCITLESELAQLRREKAELESVHQTLRKKVESAIRNIGDIVDTENGERHTVPLWVRDMLGKALRGEP